MREANRDTKTEIEMRHTYADRLSVKNTGERKMHSNASSQSCDVLCCFDSVTSSMSHDYHYACHMTLAAVAFLVAV